MAAWTSLEPAEGFPVHIAATRRGLCRLSIQQSTAAFVAGLRGACSSEDWWRDDAHPLLGDAAEQLRAYFGRARREFELPLDLRGTEFQLKVWRALRGIPYGERRSYRDIARAIGSAAATRAVGAANGRNPVAIVVPCHRVIAADGSLGGYAGGLRVKEMLLELEAGASARRAAAQGRGL
ncbi:MAG: methylated-DNA--[protein]-cysteine S-methyltransferase [Bryobacteraceae bacterium]|nr:methylated-DNA--[protein]-cysteine S-methyltransferase [Bryobacteraceae bacterium]